MVKQPNNQAYEFENTDESAEFTKEVAIQKLQEGKKIAHRYFLDYEYIKLYKGMVVDEKGYEQGTIAEYFANLNTAFNDSWTIFKKNRRMTQIQINVNSPICAEMHNYFYKNIAYLRKKRKWTQSKLARELNITRCRLSAWEENRSNPQLMTLVRLSLYFEISMLDIVTKDLQSTSTIAINK